MKMIMMNMKIKLKTKCHGMAFKQLSLPLAISSLGPIHFSIHDAYDHPWQRVSCWNILKSLKCFPDLCSFSDCAPGSRRHARRALGCRTEVTRCSARLWSHPRPGLVLIRWVYLQNISECTGLVQLLSTLSPAHTRCFTGVTKRPQLL